MESSTKNRKTRQEIERMVARAFDGRRLAAGETAVEELKEGWFNAAYALRLADGTEVVLKIAPPEGAEVMSYERNIMETEVSAMRLVRENPRIPVPKIHFHDATRDVCDADYFFMEKLKGASLAHVKPSLSPETRASLEFRTGEIVREINGFTGTWFGYPGNRELRSGSWRSAFLAIVDSVLEDGRRKGADYGHEIDAIRAVVLKHAPALEVVATPRLVHWDAWDTNFFVENGEVTGLLDFERALWADPLMEAQFSPLFGESSKNILRGYGKTSFSSEEERRCRLYTLHLALVMQTECLYRSYDTDFVYQLSKGLLATTLDWLRAN